MTLDLEGYVFTYHAVCTIEENDTLVLIVDTAVYHALHECKAKGR